MFLTAAGVVLPVVHVPLYSRQFPAGPLAFSPNATTKSSALVCPKQEGSSVNPVRIGSFVDHVPEAPDECVYSSFLSDIEPVEPVTAAEFVPLPA